MKTPQVACSPEEVDVAPVGDPGNAHDQLVLLEQLRGPCANAVKDSRRTKTGPDTRRVLVVVWGAAALGDRTARAGAWYRALLEAAGASTHAIG